jgi:hypothetical protein
MTFNDLNSPKCPGFVACFLQINSLTFKHSTTLKRMSSNLYSNQIRRFYTLDNSKIYPKAIETLFLKDENNLNSNQKSLCEKGILQI